MAEDQLEMECVSEATIAIRVVADSTTVDVNRVVLASILIARTIRRKHWQLRVNEAVHNRLFKGREAEDDDVPE